NTQQQAMMTMTFFFMTPMMYLSGFVFPIENMPDWIQPITYLIPLRYFVVILRGIFLKGVGLETLWPQALALFVWGAVILALAVRRSSKRLAGPCATIGVVSARRSARRVRSVLAIALL